MTPPSSVQNPNLLINQAFMALLFLCEGILGSGTPGRPGRAEVCAGKYFGDVWVTEALSKSVQSLMLSNSFAFC